MMVGFETSVKLMNHRLLYLQKFKMPFDDSLKSNLK